MTLATIWTLIALHWHKVFAAGAFILAAYNHYRHSKLLDRLLEKQLEPKKHKKHHKK